MAASSEVMQITKEDKLFKNIDLSICVGTRWW